MKKFRKLIPALALLIVSAVLMSTASYAWFSMNTQVTATGLNVKVKSNNTYLLINTSSDLATIKSQKLTTVNLAVPSSSAVLPSKPQLEADASVYSSGTNVTTAAAAEVPGNWYTAQNNNPSSATDSIKNVQGLVQSDGSAYDFESYVIKRTVYLTVADGSDTAYNLTVTPTFTIHTGTATDISAVRVLVATGSNVAILKANDPKTSLHESEFDITSSGTVQVDIYVYYDGSVSSVYTNNITDLAGAEISLAFDVEVKPVG